MSAPDTATLVGQVRAGSPDALDALYARCAAKLLPLIRLRMGRSLRSELDSRDILQTALMKSFERFAQFDGSTSGSLMAWLARIAENEIRDRVDYHHRRQRDVERRVPLDEGHDAVPSPVRSALTRAILSEEMQRVEDALECLSDAHREIILLRKFEELTFPEIAARLGKSEDACRMVLARAMTALTLRLSRDEAGRQPGATGRP